MVKVQVGRTKEKSRAQGYWGLQLSGNVHEGAGVDVGEFSCTLTKNPSV